MWQKQTLLLEHFLGSVQMTGNSMLTTTMNNYNEHNSCSLAQLTMWRAELRVRGEKQLSGQLSAPHDAWTIL